MASATGPFVLLHVPESHPFRGERSQTLRFVLAFVFVSTNGGYLSHLERPVIMLGTSIAVCFNGELGFAESVRSHGVFEKRRNAAKRDVAIERI